MIKWVRIPQIIFDNAAHIGGLLSVFVIGLIYFPGIKKIMDEKDILEIYDPLVKVDVNKTDNLK